MSSTTVSVVIPWRSGDTWRERAMNWVVDHWRTEAGMLAELGSAPAGAWRKAVAIRDGLLRVESELVIVSDADVWCGWPAVREAVEQVWRHGAPWALPHTQVRRLDADASRLVWNGARAPLSPFLSVEQTHRGHPGGGLLVARRSDLLNVLPDPRFAGWGQEDDSWGFALATMLGCPVWRGTAPLYHFWHPPQQRRDRVYGNDAGEALYRRYLAARNDREAMQALISEGWEWWAESQGRTLESHGATATITTMTSSTSASECRGSTESRTGT